MDSGTLEESEESEENYLKWSPSRRIGGGDGQEMACMVGRRRREGRPFWEVREVRCGDGETEGGRERRREREREVCVSVCVWAVGDLCRLSSIGEVSTQACGASVCV